jgi:mono/diheme cytochrome c family protein
MTPRPLCIALLLLAARPGAAGENGASSDFFEAKVRPVLAEHCVSCHGPKKQSAGLRLDSRQGVLAQGDHGPIVVPGDPEKSVLIQAIKRTGELKMPPKERLSPDAVEALTKWVKAGAPWPTAKPVGHADATADAWQRHWAFRPVRKPPVPATGEPRWPNSPIDSFILASLEAKGLRPSAPAERRVLIRRVTFDLTGLPPAPADIDAFLADESPDAFAKVVDRLLASPHYGERWGRHWLDVARYADTKGYVFFEENTFPWAWTYRDYVLRAFNNDLPYDRFILEQIAADLLPPSADRRSLTALGFLTLGGRFMSNVHDVIDDRIDVVTRGLMALTVTCARCHDHKYDPVPSTDYYSLYGVFASCAEPTVPPLYLPPPPTEQYARFEKELKAREQKLTDFVKAKHDELTAGARTRVVDYLLAALALRDQPSTDEFMLIADMNDLNPTMIVRWQKYLERTRKTRDPVFAPWHALGALPEKQLAAESVKVLADLDAGTKQPVNPLVLAALTARPPKCMAEVAKCYADVLHAADKKWQQTKSPLPEPAEEQLRLVFYGPDVPANVALLPYGDLSLLPDRPSQAKLQELRKALEQWRATGPGALPRANVLVDLPTPFDPYVFVRGNPNNKGPSVPRQLPFLLGGEKREPFKQGSGRLELARAVASPENPLTARVIVNRVWQLHFGTGLVTTPGDFGLRSDPPSHPELLDWVAAHFVEDGWSLKKLHRLILLSHAYQQRSDDRPECAASDPENRLLWRVARRRLDFEATRDALLAVAGTLDRRLGGPSVQNALAPGATRRTLYSFLDRLNVAGLFRTFDFPSPDATSPNRGSTTIAPQALFLMNHPFVIRCARDLLLRPEVAAEMDRAAKVERIYSLLFGRPPAHSEVPLALRFLDAGGNGPSAWERYVHALFQTNEFVWLD